MRFNRPVVTSRQLAGRRLRKTNDGCELRECRSLSERKSNVFFFVFFNAFLTLQSFPLMLLRGIFEGEKQNKMGRWRSRGVTWNLFKA